MTSMQRLFATLLFTTAGASLVAQTAFLAPMTPQQENRLNIRNAAAFLASPEGEFRHFVSARYPCHPEQPHRSRTEVR